jgi:hypothetical protein
MVKEVNSLVQRSFDSCQTLFFGLRRRGLIRPIAANIHTAVADSGYFQRRVFDLYCFHLVSIRREAVVKRMIAGNIYWVNFLPFHKGFFSLPRRWVPFYLLQL